MVKDSTGREVKFAYSAAGDLETVTDALGGITKYAYDSQHRITSITDPRGNVILKNIYDGQGRIVEQRDGLENLWKLEYKEDETIVTEPEPLSVMSPLVRPPTTFSNNVNSPLATLNVTVIGFTSESTSEIETPVIASGVSSLIV